MNKYEKALAHFYGEIEHNDHENHRQEVYLTAIEALETQMNLGEVALSNSYWISKNGNIVEFKDMTKDYLSNTIQMLKRNYTKAELAESLTFEGLCKEYMLR